MSSSLDLIISDGGRLALKNDALNYLRQIKNEVVLVTVISSTDDQNQLGHVKISLLSSMTNSPLQDSNIKGATFYTSNLKKENSGASVLFANIKSSNKHLLSLLFLSSSLFIFCVEGGINDNELSKFLNINNLPTTIELQQKSNRELIFTESSPKCIFFISNSNPNSITTFPKDYLDTELRKKSNNAQINLVRENIIKYFPDRDCILDSQQQYNILMINKIIKEMNPKTIKGKLFDGNSLAFFIQNFCEMQNSSGNPNFDILFNNLINNDLKMYQQEALNYYVSEIKKLNKVDNEENLIAKIYQSKINAIEKFNDIYNLNIDTFNNPEYKTWYTRAKTDLEGKFNEIENQKLQENSQNSEQICQQLLNKHYAIINQKISAGKYNGNNTDEYLKDYETFINGYKAEAKGNNKLKCLIDFLEVNKPNYFKSLVGSIEKENQSKLLDANKRLEDSKKRKKQQEEQYKQLNDKTEENSKRVEDISSQIERKKREIKNLNSEIERVEEEIRKAQADDNGSGQPL
jgi:hypothetical protein